MGHLSPEDLAMQLNQQGPDHFPGAVLGTDAAELMRGLLQRQDLHSQLFVGIEPGGYNLAGAIVAADGEDRFTNTMVRQVRAGDGWQTGASPLGRALLVSEVMPSPDHLTGVVEGLRRHRGVTVRALATLVNDNQATEVAATQLGLRTHALLRLQDGLVVPAAGPEPVALYRSLIVDTRDALAAHAAALGGSSLTYRAEPFRLKYGGYSHLLANLPSGHAVPERMIRTGELILDLTHGEDYQTVAGTGIDGGAVVSGVVLAASRRHRHNLTAFRGSDDRRYPHAEDDPRNGWGFRRSWVEGRRVLAVEGTCTTGGSLKDLVGMLRDAGGIVTAAAVVVNRSGRHADELAEQLGLDPATGEPVRLYGLFRLDEDRRALVPDRSYLGA